MNRSPRKHRSPAEVNSILARWKRSSKSMSAFARSEGIPLSTLSKWSSNSKSKIKSDDKAPRRIRKLTPNTPSTDTVEIVLPQGHRVRVPLTAGTTGFESVLKAVLQCSV